jgi:hypothetical protein
MIMKRTALIFGLLTFLAFFWNSCSDKVQTGTLQFGLSFTEDSQLKSALADPAVTTALVSITSETGEVIHSKEPVRLYSFGDRYVTRSLTLPVGRYRLTEFMLVDSSGVVLWATPVDGSPLSQLVTRPLPVRFGISLEQTTRVQIAVIPVKDRDPADFGYVQFPITFVDHFCFRVVLSTGSADDDGAMLTVHAGNRQVLKDTLAPGMNHYTLPLVDDLYTLSATDLAGRQFYNRQFPLRDLIRYRCGDSINPPLVIYQVQDTGIIVTPEGITEPQIEEGVFGMVTVPVKDTTITAEYDFRPVVRDLYFYPYAVLDSLWQTFAPIGCYFPVEMLNTPPVVVVRSNSGGYYQAPLAPGEYLYLVKTENGFYYDAWVSSHLPGKVTVSPGEVTRLMIHIVDCSMWM